MAKSNVKRHDARGRFKTNNDCARNRRQVRMEREYLAALSSVVSLKDWRQICRTAVADAKDGDAKARAWLAKYCLGPKPPTLTNVVVKEKSGITATREITAEAERVRSIIEQINGMSLDGHDGHPDDSSRERGP